MESFCEELACERRFMEIRLRLQASEEHARGMFEDIFDAKFNNEKRTPSEKRRKLQKSRVVAVLQNLSFFRNQVVNEKCSNIKQRKFCDALMKLYSMNRKPKLI